MRFLDEVIKAFEIHTNPEAGRCITDCPYHGECVHDEEMKDALHYLKKYRDNYEARNDQVERYQKAAKECEEILTDYVALKQYWAEQQANNPLTWVELAQMVANGKPVWIEMNHFGVHWYFIDMVTEDIVIFIGMYKESVQLYRDEYGKTWQAYRKERS